MIASFSNNFIYVKGRKVGSTSIEMSLAPFCGSLDIITPITPADEYDRLLLGGKCQNYTNDVELERRYLELVRNRQFDKALMTGVHSPNKSKFFNHMHLSDIEAQLEIPFDRFYLVISERSPYAKIFSFANMKLSFANYSGATMENTVGGIRRCIGNLFDTGEFRQVHNLALYQTKKMYKALIVLRQENLESDLKKLFGRLSLGRGLDQWPHAKKGTIIEHFDPKAIFTRDQLDLVNNEFLDEFKMFGYEQI